MYINNIVPVEKKERNSNDIGSRNNQSREISGRIVNLTNSDHETGWIRAWFEADRLGSVQIEGIADDIPVLTEGIRQGWRYRVAGVWDQCRRNGRIFRFAAIAFDTTTTDLGGLRKYLQHVVDGISDRQSRALTDAFGSGALQALIDRTNEIVERGILSADTAAAASAAISRVGLNRSAIVAELSIMLDQAARGTMSARELVATTRKLLKVWHADAACVLRERPHEVFLHASKPISFPVADRIHLDRGGDRSLPVRHLAAMMSEWHSGNNTLGETWRPRHAIPGEAVNGEGKTCKYLFDTAIADGVGKQIIDVDTWQNGSKIYALHARAEDERRIARVASALMRHPHSPWPDADHLPGISNHQRSAYSDATRSRLAILCGPPGTGKTHVMASAVLAMSSLGLAIRCAAPTGKAAQRMSEVLRGRYQLSIDCTTIHRLLEAKPNEYGGFTFARNINNRLHGDVFVIDEVSMLSADLAADLFDALPDHACVFMLGDVDQLLPVGHGKVLHDLIEAGAPVGRLEQQQRSPGTDIWRLVSWIRRREGPMPDLPTSYPDSGTGTVTLRSVAESSYAEEIASALTWFALRGLRPCDVQIIAHTQDMCNRVNEIVQSLTNPATDGEPGVPRKNDRIVNLENRTLPVVGYVRNDGSVTRHTDSVSVFVANGEMGTVRAIDIKTGDTLVDLATGEIVLTRLKPAMKYPRKLSSYGRWALGYCLTCHKAQGSEWPGVIVIPDSPKHLSRPWIYTAVSRASKHVVIFGNAGQVNNLARKSPEPRLTRLQARIAEVSHE